MKTLIPIPDLVTIDWLVETLHACEQACATFLEMFPKGTAFTAEAMKMSMEFDPFLVASVLLTDSDYALFDEKSDAVTAACNKECRKADEWFHAQYLSVVESYANIPRINPITRRVYAELRPTYSMWEDKIATAYQNQHNGYVDVLFSVLQG